MATNQKTLSVRFDSSVHAKAVRVASQHNISLSALIREGLQLAIEKRDHEYAERTKPTREEIEAKKEAARAARVAEQEKIKAELKRQKELEAEQAEAAKKARIARHRKGMELHPRVGIIKYKHQQLVSGIEKPAFKNRWNNPQHQAAKLHVAMQACAKVQDAITKIERCQYSDPDTAQELVGYGEALVEAVGNRLGITLYYA